LIYVLYTINALKTWNTRINMAEENEVEPTILLGQSSPSGIETLSVDQFLKVTEVMRRENPPKIDLFLLGQIFGAAVLEEYRSKEMALYGKSPVRGAVTQFYTFWDGKRQGLYGFEGEEGRARRNSFGKFIARVRTRAAENYHSNLNEFDLPELFALAFRDFNHLGRDLSATSRNKRASGEVMNFREALRAHWFDEARYLTTD
jgi:hypothetical protein